MATAAHVAVSAGACGAGGRVRMGRARAASPHAPPASHPIDARSAWLVGERARAGARAGARAVEVAGVFRGGCEHGARAPATRTVRSCSGHGARVHASHAVPAASFAVFKGPIRRANPAWAPTVTAAVIR